SRFILFGAAQNATTRYAATVSGDTAVEMEVLGEDNLGTGYHIVCFYFSNSGEALQIVDGKYQLRNPVQQRDYEGRFPPVLLAGIGQTLNALNICRIDRSSGDSFSNYAIKHIGIMQAVPQA